MEIVSTNLQNHGVFHWNQKIVGVSWSDRVSSEELMQSSGMQSLSEIAKNAEIEIIWPRAETVRRQTCLCSHELVPGRWQKKKRRTTTDLAYVTCRVSMSHESNMDRSKENSQ